MISIKAVIAISVKVNNGSKLVKIYIIMREGQGFIPGGREFSPQPDRPEERIENNMWRPGVLEEFSDKVAAAATTKLLFQESRNYEDVHAKGGRYLKLLGSPNRFEAPMNERLRTLRILKKIRDEIDPEAELFHIIKTQLKHTNQVAKIDADFVENLNSKNLADNQIYETDGMITDVKHCPLYVSAADCYPVGIYDPENEAIGVFHNGVWGLLKGILENGLAKMSQEYGTEWH